MVGTDDRDPDLIVQFARSGEQPIVGRYKPVSLRFFSESKVKCFERTEAESAQNACTFIDFRSRVDGSICSL